MVTPEQEKKYAECLRILDEAQNILAATIALNDPAIANIEPIVLVQETINGLKMLNQMTPEEQDQLFDVMQQQANTEKPKKKLVSTTKQGKVVLH